jgi:hypothetical protein
MVTTHYVGLDIHKKTISYCVRQGTGRFCRKGPWSQIPRRWMIGSLEFLNRGSPAWKRRC